MMLIDPLNRLIVIPLSYLRRLDSLKYTSIAALVSMAYLVVLVVYHFIKGDTMADRGPIRVIHWAGSVPTLSSFPVIVFAFTCHQNVSFSRQRASPRNHLTGSVDVLDSQRNKEQQPFPHDECRLCQYRRRGCNIHSRRHHWLPLLWKPCRGQYRRHVSTRRRSNNCARCHCDASRLLLPAPVPPLPGVS